MRPSRRQFLRNAAAFAAGFSGLQRLFVSTGFAAPAASRIVEGFGPLLPDPSGILDLPAGFTYKVISRMGRTMDDGLILPGRPDGMATFLGPDGCTVLVRNHEMNIGDEQPGPFGAGNSLLDMVPSEKIYDSGFGTAPCLGGTTSLLYDTRTGEVLGEYLSLAGTLRNCAGGPTPWNTWLSCEEIMNRANSSLEKDHGYVFEVSGTWNSGLATPNPLRAMGRFRHEAVAVDPRSGIVYLTEDMDDSLIYRFIPNVPGELAQGGRLQAFLARDQPSLDTRNWAAPQGVPQGTVLQAAWMDMDEVESPLDDLRLRGFNAGAARFARGEGMWWGNESVYFACTSGGSNRSGQIWRYVPSLHEGTPAEEEQPGRMELFIEPNDSGIVDKCDNVTVAPWGDLILCEDGSGPQFLVGVTPTGDIYKFGRNAVSSSEFAGATFSPDGTTLFVNIMHDGLTLAIVGPWRARPVSGEVLY